MSQSAVVESGRTVNAGTTWEPIFDDQPSYSIGTIALDPNDSKIVWVGTGENVGGRHVGYGDGVYRSPDGGATWQHMGLEKSEHIAMILIDPRDSNTVYVAAEGPLWAAGGDRGLFQDYRRRWQLGEGLWVGAYTGVASAVMHPRIPDILYAATWQHHRTVAALIDGGPESGIHKTTDGGRTWRELTKGLPSDSQENGEEMGLIGLAISPRTPTWSTPRSSLPGRRVASIARKTAATTWEHRNDYLSGGTGPHYYQEIFASPHKFDRVYQMDVRTHVTEDGGKTFGSSAECQAQRQPRAGVSTADPDYLLSDATAASTNLGSWANWKFIANLPVTQFYKIALDYDEPFYNIYGGTQDNNTQGGPSRTDNVQGIRNSDWFVTSGWRRPLKPAVDPDQSRHRLLRVAAGCAHRARPSDRRRSSYIQPQPARVSPPSVATGTRRS